MATLTALAHGLSGKLILLTTLNALTQRVPARATLKGAGFAARLGQRIDEGALRDFLARMGFTQAPTVTEPGDWSPRGGIIDIWPPGQPGPVRLDLFGDTLDGLRRFDPVTQRTTETLKAVELAPVSEVILDGPAITYVVGRQASDTRILDGGEIDAGNARYAGQEAMVFFDDVVVPTEHVFMDGEVAVGRPAGRALHQLPPAQLRLQDGPRRRADRGGGAGGGRQAGSSGPPTSWTS